MGLCFSTREGVLEGLRSRDAEERENAMQTIAAGLASGRHFLESAGDFEVFYDVAANSTSENPIEVYHGILVSALRSQEHTRKLGWLESHADTLPKRLWKAARNTDLAVGARVHALHAMEIMLVSPNITNPMLMDGILVGSQKDIDGHAADALMDGFIDLQTAILDSGRVRPMTVSFHWGVGARRYLECSLSRVRRKALWILVREPWKMKKSWAGGIFRSMSQKGLDRDPLGLKVLHHASEACRKRDSEFDCRWEMGIICATANVIKVHDRREVLAWLKSLVSKRERDPELGDGKDARDTGLAFRDVLVQRADVMDLLLSWTSVGHLRPLAESEGYPIPQLNAMDRARFELFRVLAGPGGNANERRSLLLTTATSFSFAHGFESHAKILSALRAGIRMRYGPALVLIRNLAVIDEDEEDAAGAVVDESFGMRPPARTRLALLAPLMEELTLMLDMVVREQSGGMEPPAPLATNAVIALIHLTRPLGLYADRRDQLVASNLPGVLSYLIGSRFSTPELEAAIWALLANLSGDSGDAESRRFTIVEHFQNLFAKGLEGVEEIEDDDDEDLREMIDDGSVGGGSGAGAGAAGGGGGGSRRGEEKEDEEDVHRVTVKTPGSKTILRSADSAGLIDEAEIVSESSDETLVRLGSVAALMRNLTTGESAPSRSVSIMRVPGVVKALVALAKSESTQTQLDALVTLWNFVRPPGPTAGVARDILFAANPMSAIIEGMESDINPIVQASVGIAWDLCASGGNADERRTALSSNKELMDHVVEVIEHGTSMQRYLGLGFLHCVSTVEKDDVSGDLDIVTLNDSSASATPDRRGIVHGFNFATVGFPHLAVDTGKWYYELHVSAGAATQRLRVGWAGASYSGRAAFNQAIGDDAASYGLEGMRSMSWNAAMPVEFGGRWKGGDVVCCCLDLDAKEVIYGLNGNFEKPWGVAHRGVFLDACGGSLFPAATTTSGVTFALGGRCGGDLKYPIPPGYAPIARRGTGITGDRLASVTDRLRPLLERIIADSLRDDVVELAVAVSDDIASKEVHEEARVELGDDTFEGARNAKDATGRVAAPMVGFWRRRALGNLVRRARSVMEEVEEDAREVGEEDGSTRARRRFKKIRTYAKFLSAFSSIKDLPEDGAGAAVDKNTHRDLLNVIYPGRGGMDDDDDDEEEADMAKNADARRRRRQRRHRRQAMQALRRARRQRRRTRS